MHLWLVVESDITFADVKSQNGDHNAASTMPYLRTLLHRSLQQLSKQPLLMTTATTGFDDCLEK